MDPRQILFAGNEILDCVLVPNGFKFEEISAGKSCGGYFASGKYTKGDRSLEIHFRWSLGLVTYHIGQLAIEHQSYMRALLGLEGRNKYPGFSDDPLDAFRDLSSDLENFGGDFLAGDGKEFLRCVQTATEERNRSGFARMTDLES